MEENNVLKTNLPKRKGIRYWTEPTYLAMQKAFIENFSDTNPFIKIENGKE